MEEFLVEAIIKALRRNPDLKITIVLDKERGLRQEHGKSSFLMLRKVIQEVNIIY